MHDPVRAIGQSRSVDTVSPLADLEEGFTDLQRALGLTFERALERTIAFQRSKIRAYDRFCQALSETKTPYVPISIFKQRPLIAGSTEDAEAVFVSSGTGSKGRSRHYVKRVSVYERSFTTHFRSVFGDGPFTLVGHLPSYGVEEETSSLVWMVRGLIERFGDAHSGLFLEDPHLLDGAIEFSRSKETKLILFGAAFGLLDLAERHRWSLPAGARVVETGGMKTHRREIDRLTLHGLLAQGFGIETQDVWSEYGMCELLSQCYSRGDDVFYPPAWMRFEIREIDNPLRVVTDGKPGLLAVADLANMYSVSAILTEDVATRIGGGFRLHGRVTGSDLRGCNMLVEGLLS